MHTSNPQLLMRITSRSSRTRVFEGSPASAWANARGSVYTEMMLCEVAATRGQLRKSKQLAAPS